MSYCCPICMRMYSMYVSRCPGTQRRRSHAGSAAPEREAESDDPALLEGIPTLRGDEGDCRIHLVPLALGACHLQARKPLARLKSLGCTSEPVLWSPAIL